MRNKCRIIYCTCTVYKVCLDLQKNGPISRHRSSKDTSTKLDPSHACMIPCMRLKETNAVHRSTLWIVNDFVAMYKSRGLKTSARQQCVFVNAPLLSCQLPVTKGRSSLITQTLEWLGSAISAPKKILSRVEAKESNFFEDYFLWLLLNVTRSRNFWFTDRISLFSTHDSWLYLSSQCSWVECGQQRRMKYAMEKLCITDHL